MRHRMCTEVNRACHVLRPSINQLHLENSWTQHVTCAVNLGAHSMPHQDGREWCQTSRFLGGLVRRLPAATISPRLGLSKRQQRQAMTARRSDWGRDSWRAQRKPFETVALLSA